MIELIFFNCDENLERTSKLIFDCLGYENILNGDSIHIVNREYKMAKVFGISMKLEVNGYDWEDEYNYMISIRRDARSSLLISDNTVVNFREIVCDLISENLNIKLAIEKSNTLLVWKSSI